MKYYIERHGGRTGDQWRIIFETEDQEAANIKYNELYEKMRQGGINLYEDDQKIKSHWSPRLRTRW